MSDSGKIEDKKVSVDKVVEDIDCIAKSKKDIDDIANLYKSIVIDKDKDILIKDLSDESIYDLVEYQYIVLHAEPFNGEVTRSNALMYLNSTADSESIVDELVRIFNLKQLSKVFSEDRKKYGDSDELCAANIYKCIECGPSEENYFVKVDDARVFVRNLFVGVKHYGIKNLRLANVNKENRIGQSLYKTQRGKRLEYDEMEHFITEPEYTTKILLYIEELIPEATKESYGRTRTERIYNYLKEHLN